MRLTFLGGVIDHGCGGACGQPAPAATQASATETALERKLPEIVFDGIGLSEAVDFLRDVTGLSIIVDAPAIKAAGLTDKSPVSLRLKDVPARAALDALTRDISKADHKFAFQAIGAIVFVSTPPRIEAAAKQYAADAAKGGKDDPAHLNRLTPDLNFKATKLADVVDFLRDITGSNIFVEWRAMEAMGVTNKALITMRRDVPLHQCLRMVLNSADAKGRLDFTVSKEAIITIGPAAGRP